MLAVMVASIASCDKNPPAADKIGLPATSTARAIQSQSSAGVPGFNNAATEGATVPSDAGAAMTLTGIYKSEPASLYIPTAPDWKGVRWTVKDTLLGVGEGPITLTINSATGRVTGAVDGPLGPGVIDGFAREGTLTATVARKDPSDRGFAGTLMASVKSGHADGTMSLSLAEASAIRQAAFALLAMDSAQPPH
ncbi:MAG TPA: hypothetical protein VGY54_23125 [Polyangiaceae bacterium]|jgi:hypothetical protein|nr:hypothetical protein [Polyangiaceae bacterium]